MRLAWYNIAHDRIRFAVTVLGITFAVFLMIFQSSILLGFLGAASKIIDSADADLWIAGRGVQCFEFPVSIERRYEQIAYSIPGVAHCSSVCIRPVQFKKADGSQQLVELIGANPDAGRGLPIPNVAGSPSAIPPHALLVDTSNAQLLGVRNRLPLDVEIDQQRARVVGTTSGFSSFLGSPYVFTSYADGSHYIGLRPDQTMFVLVQIKPGAAIRDVQRQLQARLFNADVWTRQEFSNRARFYWISQTGAGAAILTAAVLGFLVGLAVVSQAMYATTMENIEEFATLKALGATSSFVTRVIVLQALIAGLAGYLAGVLITRPMIGAAQASIPWVFAPWWLVLGILLPTATLCVAASLVSVRTALHVEPAKVFRA